MLLRKSLPISSQRDQVLPRTQGFPVESTKENGAVNQKSRELQVRSQRTEENGDRIRENQRC